jgi:hypothetical protein
MALLKRFKRKPEVSDAERVTALSKIGRITDGVIIDCEPTANGGEVVFYVYTLNGVDFESSELLSEEKMRDPLKYAPGAKVSVRYDPKNQGNSMLV